MKIKGEKRKCQSKGSIESEFGFLIIDIPEETVTELYKARSYEGLKTLVGELLHDGKAIFHVPEVHLWTTKEARHYKETGEAPIPPWERKEAK